VAHVFAQTVGSIGLVTIWILAGRLHVLEECLERAPKRLVNGADEKSFATHQMAKRLGLYLLLARSVQWANAIATKIISVRSMEPLRALLDSIVNYDKDKLVNTQIVSSLVETRTLSG